MRGVYIVLAVILVGCTVTWRHDIETAGAMLFLSLFQTVKVNSTSTEEEMLLAKSPSPTPTPCCLRYQPPVE